MAFEITQFAQTSASMSTPDVQSAWAYKNTDDTLATIRASAYFNDVINELAVDDMMYLTGSDGTDLVRVSSVTTNVTVAPFIGAGEIPDNSITEVKLVANSMTGSIAGNNADANVIGSFPLLFRVDLPGGAANTQTVTMTHKVRVLNAWVVLTAAGTTGDTVTVRNGATAISDAMDVFTADKAIVRPATLDDAQVEIAASGTLEVDQVDGGGADAPSANVYVLAVRVA